MKKKTTIEVLEFEVGDRIKYMGKLGKVVFVHPTDAVKYVVDLGDEWYGTYPEELKPAPVKKLTSTWHNVMGSKK